MKNTELDDMAIDRYGLDLDELDNVVGFAAVAIRSLSGIYTEQGNIPNYYGLDPEVQESLLNVVKGWTDACGEDG